MERYSGDLCSFLDKSKIIGSNGTLHSSRIKAARREAVEVGRQYSLRTIVDA
jgi:hypothetical protein